MSAWATVGPMCSEEGSHVERTKRGKKGRDEAVTFGSPEGLKFRGLEVSRGAFGMCNIGL